MPEGDSVRLAADRVAAAVVGRRVLRSELRVPAHATARLEGRTVTSFVPRGKHMLARLEHDDVPSLTLHTHFRMDGSWTVLGPGRRLPRRLVPDVRVVLQVDDGRTAVGLRLPVVELLPTAQEHRAVGHLGPDVLAGVSGDPREFDAALAVDRLSAEPGRPVVEALLDQRCLAGVGNLWAVETLFLRGVSPWRPAADVDLGAAVALARRMMSANLRRPGQVTTGDTRPGRTSWVYGRAGQPCLRCGTPVAARDATGRPYERETWWCPRCQPGPAPSPSQRPWRTGAARRGG